MRLIFLFLIAMISIFPQKKLLDNFESKSDWQIYKAEAVDIQISTVEGKTGKTIRLDYNFVKGAGYGGIQKKFNIALPENFQFTFYMKAESPSNNFEFKLLDSTGENVWWVNNRNFDFPNQWKKIIVKKRHISFAWGPTNDKSLKNISRIEFTIASSVGGKGTVLIDELSFEELPPENAPLKEPIISASSILNKNSDIKFAFDKNKNTFWHSNTKNNQTINFNFQQKREFSALIINWTEDYAKQYSILISDDGKIWDTAYTVNNSNGGKDYIYLKDFESNFLKINFVESATKNGFGIKEIEIKEPNYAESTNRFFINMAKDFPRGFFPRYLNEEKSYWNIIGVESDEKEALINEDGMLEVDKKNFSIEPFLYADNKFITWNDVQKTQSLVKNYLPIPFVKWSYNNLTLEIKSFADGQDNINSTLYIIYKLKNESNQIKSGNLFLTIRPFQVNPYYQWLNFDGGVVKISSIEFNNQNIKVNNDKFIFPLTKADNFGTATFDEGNITEYISKNIIPSNKKVYDKFGYASGVLKYPFELKPNEEKEIYLAIPFYEDKINFNISSDENENIKLVKEKLNDIINYWDQKVNKVKFNIPSSSDKIINTIKSNIGYILINRDHWGIQPGSRSYERSWIRDGALTSSALLRMGLKKEVKEFADWYSNYLFENGKVPCVVDKRGPDPVPENDSNGEYILLMKQYFNFTKDTLFLKLKYNSIKNAVSYLEYLISQRSTDHYQNGNDSVRAYYGILPESISHEGYSAKPMHSYWDDFFALKGLKDAVVIAHILGEKEDEIKFINLRDEFKKNLYNSIQLTMKMHNIDYIPGCVELGDFDATSTTVAIYPVDELHNLPQPYLKNTFDRYYDFSIARENPDNNWINFTPYEVRTIGSFIYLDEIEKAHKQIEFFLKYQRPQSTDSGWNHWAEVVWKDERLPRFIGDMPHTWVGSDFINSIRTMFVYESPSNGDYDSLVVIGAGLYQEWIDSPNGISVENLPTYYGDLSYSIKKIDNLYTINIYGDNFLLPTTDKIILKNFNQKKIPKNVLINGKKSKNFTNDKIIIEEFPAEVKLNY